MNRYIRIESTNRCNLRCSFCPQSHALAGSTGVMPLELFAKIVTEISAYAENREAPFYLHISGEPLLNKHIVQMVGMASLVGLKPVLTTNATLLNTDLSRRLILSGLKEIEFSFEGIDKNTCENLRTGANFEKTKANIFQFLELNERLGHPVTTVLVLVDTPEIDADLLKSYGSRMENTFDRVHLSGYFDWLGVVDSVPFEKSGYNVCSAPDTDLNVLWDGRVVPCCMDVFGEMVLGNFNTMSYLEILSSLERRELKKRLACGNLTGLPCDRCAVPWGGRAVR